MSDQYVRSGRVPLPPADAEVFTTACDYCIVACGYKAYRWPLGREGGSRAHENALGVDFPAPAMSGRWISPNQHNVVLVGGHKHHVVVLPDPDATVVNRGGNHSIRGGAIAQKCYNPDTLTRDRLQHPMLRVNGELTPVSWETAIGVMADVSQHVLARHGEAAWAMKTNSYQFYENTYAISKIAFESVQTPAYAPHDKPGPGNDTAGLDDAGIIDFGATYEDWALADVIFISGTDPYETKTVIFTEWMMTGTQPKRIIMVNPRGTMGAAWAVANGGMLLRIIPGTDTILQMAVARLILERGWEDREFIEKWLATKDEVDRGFGRGTRNTPWQWRTTWDKVEAGYKEYREWLLAQEHATLPRAAAVTGLTEAEILRVAEMLTGAGGARPRTSFLLEKGNYWSNNYTNTVSFTNLGLLCGAGNRPGRMIARLGGHQRGWASNAAPYPSDLSPQKYPGRRRQEIDLDRWVEGGHVRLAWVLGTTWTAAMAGSQELADALRRQTQGSGIRISSTNRVQAAEALKRRVDQGGMVLVWQNIYLQPPLGTDLADIVLPAATWGECDLTRANGERRLRLYSKFYDPPGEAEPDWAIIARFGREMGFDGYDWKDSNQVFVEGARFSRGGVLDYYPLVWFAKQQGRRAHEVLREYGTTGIQCPIHYERGRLVGTARLHDPDAVLPTPEGPTVHPKWLTHFNTHSGKANLLMSPWSLFADFFERITPRGDELWLTSGRVNELWQSGYDDFERRPYIRERFPAVFVEMAPADATPRGIESGDEVELWNDDVLIQTGGFVGVEADDLSYTALERAGHIRVGRGKCHAVAIVTEAIREGVLFMDFNKPGSPANALVHRVPDPVTNRYRFKLGKARIRKVGESPWKRNLERMTFTLRPVMPERT